MIDIARLSLKERQRLLREDAIRDGAMELLSSKGFSTMTMDDVANIVGISKATLYQHFPSKNELVIHVAIRKIDRAYEQMRSIDPNLPAGERLRILIENLIAFRFGHKGHGSRFVESFVDIFQMLKQSHPFREKERRNAELITQFVQAAEKEGALGPGLSPFVVVRSIIGLMRYCEFDQEINEGKVTIQEISDTVAR
ncbi:MAG: TetR/AcrR family transcriptional regulator, partial [Armatimonadota bacterium]